MNVIPRDVPNWDWITLILFSSLVIITVGKYFFKSSFFSFLMLPFNNKYLTLNKKKGKLVNGFHILLTISQVINISLFIFLSRNRLLERDPGANISEFWIVTGLVLGFILVKIILQLGNGFFFENHTLMLDLIFEKLTYFNYAGLIAFVANIFLMYIAKGNIPAVYAIFILLVIVNLVGLGNMFRHHQKLIVPNLFYFILYLCTLEIAPLVILISFLNG